MADDKHHASCEKRLLEGRLLDYAVRIISVSRAFPKNVVGQHIGKQMLRSGTSAGANYQEANGAESIADFIHKMQLVLKELRETDYWLKVVEKANLLTSARLADILQESDELIAMTVASVVTARSRREKQCK